MTRSIDLGIGPSAARGTAIVRAGHPALDAALAAEASGQLINPTLAAMRAARTPSASVEAGAIADCPAASMGQAVDGLSLTLARGRGAAVAIHVAATRRALGSDGKVRELRIWRALAEQCWN